jgi:hypothetical protein
MAANQGGAISILAETREQLFSSAVHRVRAFGRYGRTHRCFPTIMSKVLLQYSRKPVNVKDSRFIQLKGKTLTINRVAISME